jgi:hypothetical protein
VEGDNGALSESNDKETEKGEDKRETKEREENDNETERKGYSPEIYCSQIEVHQCYSAPNMASFS